MIQLDEYLIADVCWMVSFAFLLAKIIMWQRPIWLKLFALIIASMALGLLFLWTDVRRSEKAWSSLTAAKPSTSLYIECLAGLGQPFPPRDPLYIFQIADRWSGVVMFTGMSSTSLPVRPAGTPTKCSVTNDGTAPLFDVFIPVRLRFHKGIETATEQGGKSLRMGEEISSSETEVHVPRIDAGHSEMFVFFLANSTQKIVELEFKDLGIARSLSGNPERLRVKRALPHMNPIALFPES
jgi:hypothetical protein